MTELLDPDAVLDWTMNWATRLAGLGSGTDTIASATVVVTTGTATVTNITHDDTTVTFWLSAATPGSLRVTVHIVTAGGREDDETMAFYVTDR